MIKIANLVFNPFINDSRVKKESISLSKEGYFVEVIGYLSKGLKAVEKCRYFNIRRFSYLDNAINKRRITKVKVYIEYLLKSSSYCKDFDILHCNDLHTLPIAFIVKKFYNKNIKIIYDAHEYESEVIGLSRAEKFLVKIMERLLIQYYH